MKVKSINIIHPQLGEITINGTLPKEVSDTVGEITRDNCNGKGFYYADIIKNEDGTFSINNLNVIDAEGIIVGGMTKNGVHKNYITVITNRTASENIVVYPSAVMSVIYD